MFLEKIIFFSLAINFSWNLMRTLSDWQNGRKK